MPRRPTTASMLTGAVRTGLARPMIRLGARSAGPMLRLGMRGATARPDWTARAMSWRMLGSPMWPWERRHMQGRLERMERMLPRRLQRRRGPDIQAWQLLAAAVVGGCLVYFLDPIMGRRRRKQAVQRAGHVARRSLRGLGRAGRKMGADVAGKRAAMMHGRDGHEPLDDATLAHKVESILYRDPNIPKGRININAEHGVVYLRGELQRDSEMRDIENAVRHIDGVTDVRSLLHIAGS